MCSIFWFQKFHRAESKVGKYVKKAFVVLALGASLILSACGRVSAAVTMDGITIPETKVQASIDSILAERAKVDTANMQLLTGAALNRAQVRFFIISALFNDMAKELKIEVTPTDIATRKQDIYNQIGGESQLSAALVNAQIAPQDLDAYLRATIISDKLTQGLISSGVAEVDANGRLGELIMKKAESLKIEVNPRYGKWDNTLGDVIEADVAKSAVTTTSK